MPIDLSRVISVPRLLASLTATPAAIAALWAFCRRASGRTDRNQRDWLVTNCRLEITDDRGATYRTMIVGVGSDCFTADAPRRNGDVVPLAVGTPCQATVTASDAAYRFDTRIVYRHKADATMGFALPNKWMREQRRIGIRTLLRQPSTVSLTQCPVSRPIPAQVHDIGHGGALLRCSGPLTKGELVEIRGLRVGDATVAPFEAKVVACEYFRHEYNVHVAFLDMAREDSTALMDFVVSAHRRELALGAPTPR